MTPTKEQLAEFNKRSMVVNLSGELQSQALALYDLAAVLEMSRGDLEIVLLAILEDLKLQRELEGGTKEQTH